MPLQIRELHIKVTVNAEEEEQSNATNSVPDAGNSQTIDQGQIIADCVEQVMEILKEKMEP